jgi:hypothetical protein
MPDKAAAIRAALQHGAPAAPANQQGPQASATGAASEAVGAPSESKSAQESMPKAQKRNSTVPPPGP